MSGVLDRAVHRWRANQLRHYMDSYRRVYGAGGIVVVDSAVDPKGYELYRVDAEDDVSSATYVRMDGPRRRLGSIGCCCGLSCYKVADSGTPEVPSVHPSNALFDVEPQSLDRFAKKHGFRRGDISSPIDFEHRASAREARDLELQLVNPLEVEGKTASGGVFGGASGEAANDVASRWPDGRGAFDGVPGFSGGYYGQTFGKKPAVAVVEPVGAAQRGCEDASVELCVEAEVLSLEEPAGADGAGSVPGGEVGDEPVPTLGRAYMVSGGADPMLGSTSVRFVAPADEEPAVEIVVSGPECLVDGTVDLVVV